jgi:tetratricopeptide (TPR) repeat protein
MTALASWQMGDAAKALALAKSCFERDPSNGTAAEMLASLYAQVGDLVESLYYGKLAIALAPDPVTHAWLPPRFPKFDAAFLSIRDKPLLAQARLGLAGGRLDVALELARQHVEVAPNDAEGRQFFAEALLRAGRAAAAIETLQPIAAASTVAAPIASLYASALAAVGEVEASKWHERAVAAAPDDAAIAARRIADSGPTGASQRQREPWIKDWVKRFAAPMKARRWRRAGDKLVIGYLVSRLADRRDAMAVAAVARAHLRAGATIIGYGLGAQSWDENAPLRGGFDKWRDVANIDAATLAKTFAGDGLDVAIDCCGMHAPAVLRALARAEGAVRVAWLAEPRGLEGRVYDAAVAPRSARIGGEFALWQPPAGAYPLLRDWTRALQPSGGAGFCFGSDVRLSQLGPDTVALWRAVLAAAPQASLLLRANDMAPGANIGRLIARFGADLARRIDVVAAAEPEAFWYQVDLALAPPVAEMPRLAAEAVACGVPVLALESAGADAALLGDLGLGALIAGTPAAYAATAAALAGAPARRSAAAAATAAVAARGEAVAAEIAQTIETASRALLAKAAA